MRNKKPKPGWNVEFIYNGQRGYARYGPGYKRNELLSELQTEIGDGDIEIIKIEKQATKVELKWNPKV